jgi:RNA polymerase sigma factor (TIGR02999 family)
VTFAVKVVGYRELGNDFPWGTEPLVEPGQGEITLLLAKWRDGEPSAFEQLVPLVYSHLHQVAAAYIKRERSPGELQATALVDEVCMRLISQKKVDWADRTHFYTFAAKVMRMILTDHARSTIAQKRGGGIQHVALNEQIPWVKIGSESLIDLNRALDDLNAMDPYKVQLVELRFFLGCTAEETAALMQVSKATVDRDLKFIKSWLYRRIYPDAVSAALEHPAKS